MRLHSMQSGAAGQCPFRRGLEIYKEASVAVAAVLEQLLCSRAVAHSFACRILRHHEASRARFATRGDCVRSTPPGHEQLAVYEPFAW